MHKISQTVIWRASSRADIVGAQDAFPYMNSTKMNRISTTQALVTPAALKLKEAGIYLGGLSEATLRRLIRRDLIRANRALRHILIPVAELVSFSCFWRYEFK